MPVPMREARRLRRLLQRRLAQFEARLALLATSERGDDAHKRDQRPDAQQLEREARALVALMKALQAAAQLEDESHAHAARSRERREHRQDAEAALRCRLAQQLEALCAPTGPPRRGRGAE